MHCPHNTQTLKKLINRDTLAIRTEPVHLASIKKEVANLTFVRYS